MSNIDDLSSTYRTPTRFFGEGVKVEINCLLREGFSVQYKTGQTTWSFRHELDGLGQIPVLNLISEIVPE
jgi:hypothetical protein